MQRLTAIADDIPPSAAPADRLSSFHDRFKAALNALHVNAQHRIALAVSGGGDSMAMAQLALDWAKKHGTDILVLTVDHGLREDAAVEAQNVAEYFASHNIPCRILTWQGEKPLTHLQEEARHARYRLLIDACRADGRDILMLAHNAEDQMETFWMRLAHGSGLDGLAGMAPRRRQDGIDLVRPLLTFTRAELRDVCVLSHCPYIDDPSNTNERFLRVRLRGVENVLAAEGLTPQRLSHVLHKLEEARDALRFFEDQAAAACLTHHADAAYVAIDHAVLNTYPAEMRRRLLARAIGLVSAQFYPVPFPQLDDLARQLSQGSFKGVTLAGAEIFPAQGDAVGFCREASAVRSLDVKGTETGWDGRFTLRCDKVIAGLRLDLLGSAGVSFLRKNGNILPEFLPYKACCALPTLWLDDKPVFIQSLGYCDAAFLAQGINPKLLPAAIV